MECVSCWQLTVIRLFTLQPCCNVLDHQSHTPPAIGSTVFSRLVGSQLYPLESLTGIFCLPNPFVPRLTLEVTQIAKSFRRWNVCGGTLLCCFCMAAPMDNRHCLPYFTIPVVVGCFHQSWSVKLDHECPIKTHQNSHFCTAFVHFVDLIVFLYAIKISLFTFQRAGSAIRC